MTGSAGYSGTPLPRKLGIKPGSVVECIGAPRGFLATLGALPAGATLRSRPGGAPNLLLWFPRSLAELRADAARVARRVEPGVSIWIAWPKKSSGVATDLSEAEVRHAGLRYGLVDYKVCAIDTTWSGLPFTRRRSPKGWRTTAHDTAGGGTSSTSHTRRARVWGV